VALHTVVQHACRSVDAPDSTSIQRWAGAAFEAGGQSGNMTLTVRIVDEGEARGLNREFRGKGYVPNVLSFPMHAEDPDGAALLGDVVICAPVAAREAREQGKRPEAHWCHLVVHGVLHCCGFRHDTDDEAARMEPLEARILAEFGFPDPYTVYDEQ
jgi:probable rRNA maturation factor